MVERKYLTREEIIEKYKKGERNFSNIIAKAMDFRGLDFSGAKFRKSDLSFSDFTGANLTDCDFTEADLSWGDMSFTNLTRAKFKKADMSYLILNDAIIDKTDMRDVDLSWSLAFNCNLHAADLRGANTSTLAVSISEITEEGIKHVEERLGGLKVKLPFSLFMLLRHSMEKIKAGFHGINVMEKNLATYGAKGSKPTFGYGTQKVVQTSSSNKYTAEQSLEYTTQIIQYETRKSDKSRITYKK